jgi:hypothetical protein
LRGAAPSSGETSASTELPPAKPSEGGSGSQTPFSVFFSASDAENSSALSALPKIVLPANGFAAHGLFTGGNAAVSGSSSQGAQGAGAQNAVASSGNGVGAASKTSSAATAPPSQNGGTPVKDSAASPTVANVVGQAAAGSASSGNPISGDSLPAGSSLTAATAGPQVASSAAASLAGASAPPQELPVKSGTTAQIPPANPSPAGNAPQPLPGAAPGPVQVAQIANRVGQAEMRIGMNTSAFGSVEVRTTVHASEVGLTIGSEKGDLRSLLGNEMPAIASNLQQQNLRLNNVSFTQGFASPNHGGGGNPQQQAFVPRPAYSGAEAAASPSAEMADEGDAQLAGGAGGLSILA